MDQASEEISERVSALLEEMMDLLKPEPCDDPDCDHSQIPDGPWMITGWVLAVDLAAEGADRAEVETWTGTFRSKSLPRTQCYGMGKAIQHWSGV